MVCGYVTKEEMLRKGFIRREDGTIYKRNALEMIFEETNWLKNHYGKNHILTEKERRHEEIFNALNRFSAGSRLIRDRYQAGLETVKANDIRKIRVDGGGSNIRPSYRDDAEGRYVSAMRAVPVKYRRIIMALFEDEVILKPCHASDLRTGLDCLIKHYLRLNLK